MSQAWEMEKTTETWEEKGIPNPPPLKTNKQREKQPNKSNFGSWARLSVGAGFTQGI